MKSKLYALFFALITLCILDACNDDDVTIVDPDPITPDLTEKITASVTGFVADEDGTPIVYANVDAGDKHALTDEYGYFEIPAASLAKFAGQVKVSKTGYFDGYKTFITQANKENFVRVKLLTKTEIGTISASSGGSASSTDGATVTLPAEGVVTASTNASYTGDVHVNVRLIDPAAEAVPGDARGTSTDGYAKALKAFTTVAVELTGSNGQTLQIKDGKSATITLPIPAALASDAPATIALWSFNTETGLWKQEGTATKTGGAYIGTVEHFSFWEGAEGIPLVNFSARVVDASSQPLAHVPVTINIGGLPKNAGYGKFGYTDANGYISGAVFANANLVLDILTPCALSAYSHEFSTAATDIDLGTLTGNLGQSVVTLSGTVRDCENQPVADGYVQTYDNGFYNRIAITNGTFSFTGLACTNTDVNIVVVDYATNEQNIPASVHLNAGVNNLGTLTACGTSTMGFINYTYDDVSVSIQEPTDTVAAYNLTPAAWTQVVTLSGNPNESQKMAFQFDGGSDPEGVHKFSDVFSNAFPSGRGYAPVPVTVTITEYGPVGGFISGEFSTDLILDFNDNSIHSLTCSFRIRRRQ